MSAATWWPLFPLLFVIVLTALITAAMKLRWAGGATRGEWISTFGALLFYFLTFALGRWRWLHMPISNVAELFIFYNVVHFYRKGWKAIAWLNIIALLAIAIDFALHFILK